MPGEKKKKKIHRGSVLTTHSTPHPSGAATERVTQAGQGTHSGGAIHASYHVGFPGGASSKEPASQGQAT